MVLSRSRGATPVLAATPAHPPMKICNMVVREEDFVDDVTVEVVEGVVDNVT